MYLSTNPVPNIVFTLSVRVTSLNPCMES
jgi:hypothetical protein